MSRELIISPVSIDLGAKNTGVYFAHYKADSSIEDIKKEGMVYQLEKDNYTLLMANRTAARHQRRGHDRRQMVKRLFRLIWCEHFGLEWDNEVQQTIGFLLNRRGFSFLNEEYNAEVLSRFPEEAYNLLPNELQIEPNESGEYDYASQIQEWAREGENKVKEIFDVINKEPKRVAERQVFISRTNKLKDYCETRKDNQEIEKERDRAQVKLSQLSKWIWDKWQQTEVQGLDETFTAKDLNNGSEIKWKNPVSFDLVTYLNQKNPKAASQILNSLPDTSTEEKELNDSFWNFTAETFKLEDKDFTPLELPEENADTKRQQDDRKAVSAWKRLHLQHLAFALHKINEEVTSGGRHRSKYFEEIKEVLKHEEHSHGYLKAFCKKLQSEGFYPIDVRKLTNLIGHLSNLELKPLRKYFNDKAHQKADYWNEARLSKLFDRWILREWRVNSEKDKDKAKGKPGDYKKLCKDWKEHSGTVIDFWLKTDPFRTIPPYQDNNNRRPPRCQSLILNPTFLENHYPEWQNWLEELKKLETVQDHLEKFEKELKDPKSGKGKSYFSHDVTGSLLKDSGRRTNKDLNARLLQFIFDRVKADDSLRLNEIYSRTKKYRQSQSTTEEKETAKNCLEKAIEYSELPDMLKSPRNYQHDAVFDRGGFLYLVCQYYKIRQKARDGRVFIHPEYRYTKDCGYENTGRFEDKEHLLTYCNHKPRQKRYQMLGDLAGLIQVAPKQLEEFVQQQDESAIDEKLFNWLKNIPNLKTRCDQAAKEQKEHRGRLKLDIQNIYGLIYDRRQSKSPSVKEIKGILKNSKVHEASKLHSFCERAKESCLRVTQSLYDAV